MMENYLNSLLMGKTPDGIRPEKSGFFIIGTQNPASMAGRRLSSIALARRFMTLSMSAYDNEEMISILTHKGVPPKRLRG